MQSLLHPVVRAAATLALLVAPVAAAQAVPTADQHVRLTAYGMATYLRPEYHESRRGAGVTAGVNLDGVRLLPQLELGADVRGMASHGGVINESYFAAGPRVSYRRFRLQPYAEYLFGIGRGYFHNAPDPNYTHDTTAIRSYGGGVDLRATRYVSLRADVQRQRWRFTSVVPYFHPVDVSVGIAYQLHFRSRTGPRD